MIANQYQVVGQLGSGAFADVLLVKNSENGQNLACKIIKKDASGQVPAALLEDVQKEVTLLSRLSHNHIVKIQAVGRGPYQVSPDTEPTEVVFILMELAQEGEMFDIIMNSKAFSEPVARHYFLQLLSTLNYMHNSAGVCHRDLKLENILLDKDFNMKIADFGFATEISGRASNGKLKSFKGTLSYMAPE